MPPQPAVHAGYLYRIALTGALAGLLFGFDTAVINGALLSLRTHFALSEFQVEFAASSLLYGCFFGAMAAGILSDRYGRRSILRLSAVLFLFSAIFAAVPANFAEFLLARFLGGLGIGFASTIAPLYLAEVSPREKRGSIVTLNQTAIVMRHAAGLLHQLGAGRYRRMRHGAGCSAPPRFPHSLLSFVFALFLKAPAGSSSRIALRRPTRLFALLEARPAAQSSLKRFAPPSPRKLPLLAGCAAFAARCCLLSVSPYCNRSPASTPSSITAPCFLSRTATAAATAGTRRQCAHRTHQSGLHAHCALHYGSHWPAHLAHRFRLRHVRVAAVAGLSISSRSRQLRPHRRQHHALYGRIQHRPWPRSMALYL